jgi:hypothetical protein
MLAMASSDFPDPNKRLQELAHGERRTVYILGILLYFIPLSKTVVMSSKLAQLFLRPCFKMEYAVGLPLSHLNGT